jgi:type I restriction enzyme R subunit
MTFARRSRIARASCANVEKKIGPDGKETEEIVWKKVANLSPDQILQAFRNSYNPRIAVTVDMIATGTDVKPLEIVFFMRSVKSRGFFEQMKGRGVRVISETEMEQVNPASSARIGSLSSMPSASASRT